MTSASVLELTREPPVTVDRLRKPTEQNRLSKTD